VLLAAVLSEQASKIVLEYASMTKIISPSSCTGIIERRERETVLIDFTDGAQSEYYL
jgi:hypothetical protein